MTQKAFIEVEMLPAAHGDALLVHYGQKGQTARMLIDGGPFHTYPHLLRRLLMLPQSERHFELLVITHIDGDHIDGILRLLQEDLPALGMTFGDVWFNGMPQLERVLSDGGDQLGAKEGEYLQALLTHLELPWNQAFDGGPILARPNDPVTLPSGAKVRLFSPTRTRLVALHREWKEVMRGEGMPTGPVDNVLAHLRTSTRFRPIAPEPDMLGGGEGEAAAKEPDSSVANGSSIAFTLEVGRRKVLFTGDAHVPVLIETLDEYLKPGKQLTIDALKVPHHGSSGNLTTGLLDRIRCRHYLFSTNGSIFNHPDHLAVQLVLDSVARPELWFNYATDRTARWLDPELGQGAVVHLPAGLVYP